MLGSSEIVVNKETLQKAESGSVVDTTLYTKYMRDISALNLLKKEEEYELAVRAQKGDFKARDEMIVSNLRLVVKLARKYKRSTNSGYSLLDLIEEGNIGLMKAVDKFDPLMGYRFSTYAAWWINDSIITFLHSKSRTVRLPVHISKQISQIERIKSEISSDTYDECTTSQIAEKADLTISQASSLLLMTSSKSTKVSADIELKNSNIDSVIYEGHDLKDEIEQSDFYQQVLSTISTMSDKHRLVLEHRYGLNKKTQKTLKEVGDIFGVTNERARQIQQQAISRLKNKLERDGWI